jgi:hypothetical protein
MSRHKGAPTKGRSITIALKAADGAVQKINEMDSVIEHMTPKQESLFKAMMSGFSPLECAIMAGYQSWYKGISKNVKLKTGEWFKTADITLNNISLIDESNIEHLNSICSSQIRKITAEEDYRKYTDPVREFFQRLAPLAAMTINGIREDVKVKPETRLKAAKDMLDRAGQKAPEEKADVVIPVMVQINLTGKDGEVTHLHGNN